MALYLESDIASGIRNGFTWKYTLWASTYPGYTKIDVSYTSYPDFQLSSTNCFNSQIPAMKESTESTKPNHAFSQRAACLSAYVGIYAPPSFDIPNDPDRNQKVSHNRRSIDRPGWHSIRKCVARFSFITTYLPTYAYLGGSGDGGRSAFPSSGRGASRLRRPSLLSTSNYWQTNLRSTQHGIRSHQQAYKRMGQTETTTCHS